MAIGVFGEIAKGKLTKTTLEALTKATFLKEQMNIPTQLILVGEAEDFKSIDKNCGSDSIIMYTKSGLNDYTTEVHLELLFAYYKKYKPDILIFTGGIRGIELAPRLAYRVNVNAMLDCTDLTYDNMSKELCVTKPIYGSNVYGEFTSDYPLIIALRPHQCPIRIHKKTYVSIINENVNELKKADWIIKKNIIENTANSIEDAKILVVCGRGVGGIEGIKKAEILANELGGVIGGTKKAIDNGWLPINRMIGQTGKIVSPDLCIVIGTSGATPFINGIQTSKVMVAINKDKHARIFEYADIGIIEDYDEIVPIATKILHNSEYI